MTDVVRTVTVRATGEIISLGAPTDILAEHVDQLKDMKSQIDEALGEVNLELLRRMDLEAKWTARVGPWTVRGDSPAPKVDYNGEQLYEDLYSLAARGDISYEALEAAVEQITGYKVKVAGVNALKKRGGKIAEVIEAAASTSERRRSVRVERAA